MIQSYTNNNAKLYYRYPNNDTKLYNVLIIILIGILIMIQSYTNNNAKLY